LSARPITRSHPMPIPMAITSSRSRFPTAPPPMCRASP